MGIKEGSNTQGWFSIHVLTISVSRVCGTLVISSYESFYVRQFSVKLFTLFLRLLPPSILEIKALVSFTFNSIKAVTLVALQGHHWCLSSFIPFIVSQS